MASDVGATLTGVEAADLLAFSYELVWAVVKGELNAEKVGEALAATGHGDAASRGEMLPEILWYAAPHKDRNEELEDCQCTSRATRDFLANVQTEMLL